MERKSIRDIFAEEVGDSLQTKIGYEGFAPEPEAPALNDNTALREIILNGIYNNAKTEGL